MSAAYLLTKKDTGNLRLPVWGFTQGLKGVIFYLSLGAQQRRFCFILTSIKSVFYHVADKCGGVHITLCGTSTQHFAVPFKDTRAISERAFSGNRSGIVPSSA